MFNFLSILRVSFLNIVLLYSTDQVVCCGVRFCFLNFAEFNLIHIFLILVNGGFESLLTLFIGTVMNLVIGIGGAKGIEL